MKRDKNGAIHDSAGRFVPKMKPTYIVIRMWDKLQIAGLLMLFLYAADFIKNVIAPNAAITFKALVELWSNP